MDNRYHPSRFCVIRNLDHSICSQFKHIPHSERQSSIENMPSSQTNGELKTYCCGCDSRTASLNANVFLFAVGCLYATVGIYGINDPNPNSAPTDGELLYIKTFVGFMAIQLVVSGVAIWGLCTYRGWPVMLSLGWITTSMTLASIGGLVVTSMTGNPLPLVQVAIGLLIQTTFFFMPMYGYINEYEKLKEARFASEMAESGEDFAEKGNNASVEMV